MARGQRAAPVTTSRWQPGAHFVEQRGIASPQVLLGRHVGCVAEPAGLRRFVGARFGRYLQTAVSRDINIGPLLMALASRRAKAGAAVMTDRSPDPRTIEQQEQQHAERNRAATRRGLEHARREEHQETPEPSTSIP